jgi:hypothetical protein
MIDAEVPPASKMGRVSTVADHVSVAVCHRVLEIIPGPVLESTSPTGADFRYVQAVDRTKSGIRRYLTDLRREEERE